MPSGSHVPCCSSVIWSRRVEHDDLVAGLGVRGAAQRREQVVGVRAVATRSAPASRTWRVPSPPGVTAAIERPMSPPVPISEVTDATGAARRRARAGSPRTTARRRGGARSRRPGSGASRRPSRWRRSGGPARSRPPRSPRTRRRRRRARRARAPTARARSRSASTVSTGKRASRSTSSAFGAATSSAMPADAREEGLVAIDGDAHAALAAQLVQRRRDRGDALEDAAGQHRDRGTRRRRRPRARASR